MIEELQAILALLGDVTAIGGWVFGGWIAFKAIILLSTTGAVVYLSSMGIQHFSRVIDHFIDSSERKANVVKREPDIAIKGICITQDGTYEHVVDSLRVVANHIGTASGTYIHSDGADWLRKAITEKIVREKDEAS